MSLMTVLTGPAASGKNTIADLYAAQYCERCAVIDVDVVRGMLRQPHIAPWEGDDGLKQHQLGVKHACLLAKSFAAEGYEVILLDVVWSDLGQRYRQELGQYGVRIVRLMTSWDESLRRLHERTHTITDAEAHWVYTTQQTLQDFDHTLDNTDLPAETVALWLALLPQANPV